VTDDVGRGESFERGTRLVEAPDLIGAESVDAQASTGSGLNQAFLLGDLLQGGLERLGHADRKGRRDQQQA
jgi:hypothetical protein